MKNRKLIRITTVSGSLRTLLKGQHKYMSQNGFEVIGVSSPGLALDEVQKNEGIRTVAIEMARQPAPLKDLVSLLKLIRLFRKEKPDIVHTHTPKAGLLGMMAAYITRVPYRLHTVAGMPLTVATGAKKKMLNFMEQLTYACATNVYPNSIGLKELIIEYNFAKPEKLKVIGNGSSNGIDTTEFNPNTVSEETKIAIRSKLGISEADFVFLFVGRVVTDKGVNELVSAFDALSRDFKKAHLVIVGRYENYLDPLLVQTEQLINSHPRIHAVGYKKNVCDCFAMADLLTFPSYREGFPNVVMQAASMQLNCIVSDINGCNEIISHGKNGWIVPAQNNLELEKYMRWCASHPAESKKMGLKSRKLMQQKFERSFVQAELLKEYKRVLIGRTKR